MQSSVRSKTADLTILEPGILNQSPQHQSSPALPTIFTNIVNIKIVSVGSTVCQTPVPLIGIGTSVWRSGGQLLAMT